MIEEVKDSDLPPSPLSMRQAMAIWGTGKCRCPVCGRFAKEEDFYGSPTTAQWPGMIVSLLPECRRCREGKKQ